MRGVVGRRGSMAEFFGDRNDLLLCCNGGERSDYSPSKNNLVTTAGPGTAEPPLQGAFNTKGLVNILTSSNVAFNSPKVTVLLWLKVNSYKPTGTSGRVFVTSEAVLTNSFILNESDTTPKKLSAGVFGTSGVLIKDAALVPVGIFNLFGVLFDNSTAAGIIRMSLNGDEQPLTTRVNTKAGVGNFTSRKLSIGASETMQNPMDITVSDFALFSSDLFTEPGNPIQQYYAWATQDGPMKRFNRLRRMRR